MKIVLRSHKSYLLSNKPNQKLYVMLKIIPEPKEAQLTNIALSVVVDTSGSMQSDSGDGILKIQKVIEILSSLPNLKILQHTDILSLIKFDSDARLLWEGNLRDNQEYSDKIRNLNQYSGSTYMAKGLQKAIQILDKFDDQYLKKILIFTDGQAFDEDIIKKKIIKKLIDYKIPLIAIGVGSDYNEKLLSQITDQCAGIYYHLTKIEEFKEILFKEIINIKRESIRNIFLDIYKPSDIFLEEIVRIYPSFYKVKQIGEKYFLGNLIFSDESIFLLQLTIPPRGEGRYLCLSIKLEYNLLGKFLCKDEIPLYIEFTQDEYLYHRVDQEIMNYVYQRRVQNMLDDAVNISKENPKKAEDLLRMAKNLTKQLGNINVTKTINVAINNLKTHGSIDSNITKRLMSDGRTKTVRYTDSPHRFPVDKSGKSKYVNPRVGLTDKEIKRLTGA